MIGQTNIFGRLHFTNWRIRLTWIQSPSTTRLAPNQSSRSIRLLLSRTGRTRGSGSSVLPHSPGPSAIAGGCRRNRGFAGRRTIVGEVGRLWAMVGDGGRLWAMAGVSGDAARGGSVCTGCRASYRLVTTGPARPAGTPLL